jgi:hypothetical protein
MVAKKSCLVCCKPNKNQDKAHQYTVKKALQIQWRMNDFSTIRYL